MKISKYTPPPPEPTFRLELTEQEARVVRLALYQTRRSFTSDDLSGVATRLHAELYEGMMGASFTGDCS